MKEIEVPDVCVKAGQLNVTGEVTSAAGVAAMLTREYAIALHSHC